MKRLKILFLDDDGTRHYVFETRLGKYYDIDHVWTAESAANTMLAVMLLGDPYDLVCLDHDLGNSTGQDTAREMAVIYRDAAKKPRVIIHAHNPIGAQAMKHILENAGFEDVILHPFDLKG